MKLFLLTILLFFLNGCATTMTSKEVVPHKKPSLTLSQEEKWMKMVGKWYGEQPTKSGGKRSWIVERNNDGTYLIVFRNYDAEGKISESAEVGQWAVSGPVYLSMFRGRVRGDKVEQVDPSNPYNYDAYEILQLDDSIFKYRHYEIGATFVLKKVADDFKFPE